MSYETIIVNAKENGLLEILLNRPNQLNALNQKMFEEILDAVTAAELDENVKVVVFSGQGKAFAAGADITSIMNASAVEVSGVAKTGLDAFRKIESMNKVAIAAVNGIAFGGGFELALCCDLRVASSNAKFALPETGLGIMPGSGGTQRLPRLVGKARALEIILTGKTLTAQEALEWGILNSVCSPGELMDEVHRIAGSILAKGQIAIGYALEAVDKGLQTDIDTGLSIENRLFALCFATQDQKEGMKAFAEKRPPAFQGR
ncbi:MAG: enoyl-CoA hydratase-related protein [Clostridiales bacterium]|nr:enoyl-CoA hydratase-related protein [Clostridiales bacterium]